MEILIDTYVNMGARMGGPKLKVIRKREKKTGKRKKKQDLRMN